METLLKNYSITEILLLIFFVVLAVKELLGIIDFFKNRTKKHYDEDEEKECAIKEVLDKLNILEDKVDKIQAANDKQQDLLDLLKESDKDQLKGFIVKQYHYFCDNLKWIDDFSMDTVEKCYSHYKKEGGNSYIHDLMEELRKLPHKHP